MNKLLYIITALLTLSLFSACGSDDDNTEKKEEVVYPKTDSIFGYRFGSSMEEVKPDIIRNKDLAFTYSGSLDLPATVFYFQNNKLTTISKYYSADIRWLPQALFLHDIKELNPTQPIEIIKPPIGEYISYIMPDSISWTYNHLEIMVRNDYFDFGTKGDGNIYDCEYSIVIEYQQLN